MKDEIEKLLAYGRMDFEAGYYDVARGYYQKVLQLDADNELARQAIAEIDALLERRRASFESVKPTVEPTKPRRADQLVAMLEGKGRWLALALIPVALIVLAFAYQRVVPVLLPTPTPTSTPMPTPTPTPDYTEFCRDLGAYYEGASRLMDAMPAIGRTGDPGANQRLYQGWLLLSPPEIARPFHEYMLKMQEEAIAALIAAQNQQPDVSDRHKELMNMYVHKASNALMPILNALNTYCGYSLKYEDFY